MKCTVIDDEPHALELIKTYISRTPFLESGECFSNPFKAIQYLGENKTDLIFLDINMPELTGIQLLRSLPTPPLVIFTTAYPEFGAESYEYNAVDYLLKPVKYDRFLKAVNKASELLGSRHIAEPVKENKNTENDYIYIKSGTRMVKIFPSEILYIEGAGNYMIFHTAEKKILSLLNMQETIDLLPKDMFARIHKSFLVSLNHIEAIEKHDVIVRGKPIPIGSTYREAFLQRINRIKG
jgi:two-component system, LytTR family, response regulator